VLQQTRRLTALSRASSFRQYRSRSKLNPWSEGAIHDKAVGNKEGWLEINVDKSDLQLSSFANKTALTKSRNTLQKRKVEVTTATPGRDRGPERLAKRPRGNEMICRSQREDAERCGNRAQCTIAFPALCSLDCRVNEVTVKMHQRAGVSVGKI
jgi:hypothetical protein